jgi:hypothetical protein
MKRATGGTTIARGGTATARGSREQGDRRYDNRWVLYQQFTDGGEEEEDGDATIPAPWTDADEAGLVALRNAPIEMADTSYGRFLATQKRDAERAYQHMDAEEREAFLQKLTEIDADDTEDGQSPPSNPTPV